MTAAGGEYGAVDVNRNAGTRVSSLIATAIVASEACVTVALRGEGHHTMIRHAHAPLLTVPQSQVWPLHSPAPDTVGHDGHWHASSEPSVGCSHPASQVPHLSW